MCERWIWYSATSNRSDSGNSFGSRTAPKRYTICYGKPTRNICPHSFAPGGARADEGATLATERDAVIRNREGLHFRPIMQLVDLASQFRSDIVIHCEDRKAGARSPMELLMLVATQGSKLRLVADGEDEEHAVDALVRLIESGFNET
ncbi:MAG: HPr family phosphocarrier protein [Planctomycetota bacterium]|nr:MAG: HPr family phosphocarrier protein [Planctomycetota bacterium]